MALAYRELRRAGLHERVEWPAARRRDSTQAMNKRRWTQIEANRVHSALVTAFGDGGPQQLDI